jgi:hypothetical protein
MWYAMSEAEFNPTVQILELEETQYLAQVLIRVDYVVMNE